MVDHIILMETSWEIEEVSREKVRSLASGLNISDLSASFLIARTIDSVQKAKEFLYPSPKYLHDPFLLKDMEEAVRRICEAIEKKEKICICGHEDVDGITATCVLFETLKDMGAYLIYYIPSKKEEGQGLVKNIVDTLFKNGVKLIITVDCGISNVKDIEYAKSKGIDVIISDHHEIPKTLPDAVACIDPKREDDTYPIDTLPGVGISFKLAQAVSMKRMKITPSQFLSVKKDLTSLVLLGVMADRVPLLEENRSFYVLGSKSLQESNRVWVKTLRMNDPNQKDTVIPRNIVPILSSARSKRGLNPGCEFLLTNDGRKASKIYNQLLNISKNWHKESKVLYDRIKENAKSSIHSKLIVAVDFQTSPYLLGYFANRLREEFSRPAFVIGLRKNSATGEGRGIKSFNLVECLKTCDDILLDYGGHKQAAGFSINVKNISEFKQRVKHYANINIDWNDLTKKIEIDVETSLNSITDKVLDETGLFAPFGKGNRQPLILVKDVELKRSEDGYICIDRNGTTKLLHANYPQTKWVSLSGEPIRLDCIFSLNKRKISLFDSRPSFKKFNI